MAKIIVFDGMHIAYRNRFVMKDLKNSVGKSTGSIFGVVNSIHKIQRDYPEHRLLFCWDNRPTVRKRLDPEYKANREEKPDWYPDFLGEIHTLKKIIKNLGIDQYSAIGYEADDVAFHVRQKHIANYRKNGELIYVTGDSDWFQLLSDKYRIRLYRPVQNKIYEAKDVCEEYDIPSPDKLVFHKVLRGDKADNVPGIPRFPTKSIIHISKTYKDVKDLIKNVGCDEAINERWRNEITSNKKRLLLNEQLVKLQKLKRPIAVVKGVYDEEALLAHYRYLDFDKFRNEIVKKRMKAKKV